MHRNHWARALQSGGHNCWSPCSLEPMLWNKRSHHSEKPTHHKRGAAREKLLRQQRPSTAKNKSINKIFKEWDWNPAILTIILWYGESQLKAEIVRIDLKKNSPTSTMSIQDHLNIDTGRWKVNGWKKIQHANYKHKSAEMTTLI